MKRFIYRKTYRDFYLKHVFFRIVKGEGTPESIGRAVAIGLFVGFAVPLGLQIPAVLILAFLLKANKLTSIAASLFTNVFTVAFIYPIICYIGARLLGETPELSIIKERMHVFFVDPGIRNFFKVGQDVIIWFFTGGISLGLASAFGGYFAAIGMVLSYRRRIQKKLAKRLSVHR